MPFARIYAEFAAALKARLNGETREWLVEGAAASPARARQAGVPEPVIASAAADALGFPFTRT